MFQVGDLVRFSNLHCKEFKRRPRRGFPERRGLNKIMMVVRVETPRKKFRRGRCITTDQSVFLDVPVTSYSQRIKKLGITDSFCIASSWLRLVRRRLKNIEELVPAPWAGVRQPRSAE